MSGFKNFVLRGNLVDLAVAVVIGTAFATVVAAFTAWLTETLVGENSDFFSGGPGSFGFFLNAVFAFLIMATVIYFFVVLPYTTAREKFFPSPAPGTPEDIVLLKEIRDLLATQQGTTPPPTV